MSARLLEGEDVQPDFDELQRLRAESSAHLARLDVSRAGLRGSGQARVSRRGDLARRSLGGGGRADRRTSRRPGDDRRSPVSLVWRHHGRELPAWAACRNARRGDRDRPAGESAVGVVPEQRQGCDRARRRCRDRGRHQRPARLLGCARHALGAEDQRRIDWLDRAARAGRNDRRIRDRCGADLADRNRRDGAVDHAADRRARRFVRPGRGAV